jgi:hypothetical protein
MVIKELHKSNDSTVNNLLHTTLGYLGDALEALNDAMYETENQQDFEKLEAIYIKLEECESSIDMIKSSINRRKVD